MSEYNWDHLTSSKIRNYSKECEEKCVGQLPDLKHKQGTIVGVQHVSAQMNQAHSVLSQCSSLFCAAALLPPLHPILKGSVLFLSPALCT